MRKIIAWAPALILAGAVGSSFAGEDQKRNAMMPDAKASLVAQSQQVEDFGPAASNAEGALLLGQIEAKWGNVMRSMKGWNAGSFQQFREGYRNAPVSVLEKALAADTFDGMQAAFNSYATVKAQKNMAKAFPMGNIRPEDASNPQVVEAHQLVGKALGEDARDLVFIPITPCTVWDTRFATDTASAGIIGPGVTRLFYSHYNGAGGTFAPWGGNPSCPETAQNSIGGRPFAVMMTAYINDAAGQGWLTFYRDGDPDPSNATISVYYSAGPTRTQTVISKSSRGYGTGTYDVAVTGRFSSANATAAVTGYFIKPQATTLDCLNTTSFSATNSVAASATSDYLYSPVCTAGYLTTGGGCYSDSLPSMYLKAQGVSSGDTSYFCVYTNLDSVAHNAISWNRCCRIPGRP